MSQGAARRQRGGAAARWLHYMHRLEAPPYTALGSERQFRERQTSAGGQGHLFPVLFAPEPLRRLMAERVGEDRRVDSPPRL